VGEMDVKHAAIERRLLHFLDVLLHECGVRFVPAKFDELLVFGAQSGAPPQNSKDSQPEGTKLSPVGERRKWHDQFMRRRSRKVKRILQSRMTSVIALPTASQVVCRTPCAPPAACCPIEREFQMNRSTSPKRRTHAGKQASPTFDRHRLLALFIRVLDHFLRQFLQKRRWMTRHRLAKFFSP